MAHIERQDAVLNILRNLRDMDSLKRLFWQELNYERENRPLSPRQWPEIARQPLAEDPILFATGGEDNAFHVVYCRLNSETLSRGDERPIVNRLTREHPYALFVFSNRERTDWHFLNVKYDEDAEKRQLLRRITVRPGEGLRTAAERLQMLDLASIGGTRSVASVSPLDIQSAHDDAFDVEKVTKDFYREIANWYFWALKHPNMVFPRNVKSEQDQAIFLIRLLTRLIFCWFTREKGLIPHTLFNDREVAGLLKDTRPEAGTYYRAILQNLFFATLNQESDMRKFRVKHGEGRDGNRGATNLYRFANLLTDPDAFLQILRKVPFINGGLFDCLDTVYRKDEKRTDVRMDDFSEERGCGLCVPNELFFGASRRVDLNALYGDKRHGNEAVRGLIHTLEHYQFTVEENTPFDQSVALDPELLGKVFENLLAAYNPETGTTARKATGSFYTPREIVDYMVDESLVAYLKGKLTTEDTENTEKKLRGLLAYDAETPTFSVSETETLIEAIDGLKALDPAVGSGAFPMGMLHKLVHVLGRLDPGNERWKAKQIAKLDDAAMREDAERLFRENYDDYGRKLYLIENCIYGVDIQPIAVQIAKMRFFISLIVDQKVNPKAPNLGVRALPNLETKFVAANTLIGIDRPAQMMLRNPDIDKKEAELRQVRQKHFTARTLKSKAKCREDDKRLRGEIAGLLKTDGWDNTTAKQLASWDPYDQNASAGFFDPEWMFAVTDGFDVIITNPPYLKERDNKKTFDAITGTDWGRKFHEGKMDYWFFFLHRGLELASGDGAIAFITSRYWLNSAGSRKLIKHIRDSDALWQVVDIGDLPVFEHVAGHHMLHFYAFGQHGDMCTVKRLAHILDDLASESPTKHLAIYRRKRQDIFSEEDSMFLYDTALRVDSTLTLGSVFEVSQGVVQNPDKVSGVAAQRYDLPRGEGVFVLEASELKSLGLEKHERAFVKDFYDEAAVSRFHLDRNARKHLLYITKKNCSSLSSFPHLRKHLLRYRPIMEARRETKQGTIEWFQLHWPRDPRFFESGKVILPSMFSRPCAAFVQEAAYFGLGSNVIVGGDGDCSLEALCGLLNSSFASHWFIMHGKHRGVGVDIGVSKLRSFPLPQSNDGLALVAARVRQIIALKKADTEADTADLERQIDQRVYKLYGLSAEEIKIVEGATDGTRRQK